jgi:hypothetical protein
MKENGKIDFNDTTGSLTDFFVDEKLALEIGTAVLYDVFGEELISNTYFIVREVYGDVFFVVTRLPDNNIPGADYNVAIKKRRENIENLDGRII